MKGSILTMLKHLGYGLIAGAVATAVMDTSQRTVIPAVSSWIEARRGDGDSRKSQTDSGNDQSESSPARVAHRFANKIGVEITTHRAEVLGNRIHWAYGTLWGLVYELVPVSHGPRTGLLYGDMLWLGSDELLLWGLGIADKPTSYPLATHVKALAAHAIYGVALGSTTLALESLFHTDGDGSTSA
jgi:hypothetical protein